MKLIGMETVAALYRQERCRSVGFLSRALQSLLQIMFGNETLHLLDNLNNQQQQVDNSWLENEKFHHADICKNCCLLNTE